MKKQKTIKMTFMMDRAMIQTIEKLSKRRGETFNQTFLQLLTLALPEESSRPVRATKSPVGLKTVSQRRRSPRSVDKEG
jgi:hypothetical protein